MPTRHPEYAHPFPAYAAFKPADLPEAERGLPAGDLREYAQARGLEFLDTRNPVGYWGVVPGDERLQFNVVRGMLPGGRHGILFHHALEVGLAYDSEHWEWYALIGAEVHGLEVNIDKRGDPRRVAAGVPTTVAATLIPQLATLPGFQFVNHDNLTLVEKLFRVDRIELEPYGFPDMWVEPPAGPQPDQALVERMIESSFAGVLRGLGARAYLQVRIDHGQLAIGIDGYVHEPGVLDVLAEAVAAAAAGIEVAAAPMHRPQPFDQPLPDANWPEKHTPEQVLRSPAPYPPEPYVPGMLAGAEKRGWTPEDSIAYHLAFPNLPVPGTAFAVMRFTPPGSSVTGRVAWHAERPMSRYNIGRNAVLLPAAPGAAPTPPGGVRRGDMNLNYAVVDGIFSVWQGRDQDPINTMVGMEALVAQALELARAEGLAQL